MIIRNEHFGVPEKRVRVAQGFQSIAKPNSPFQKPNRYKTVATNLRGFGVPFQINAQDQSFIEVQLYLSRDMGKSWQFHSRQSTDRVEFPFQAEEDGEYWFALKTLNRDRRLVPEGDPEIDLKIIVDTVKPELDFRIEPDAAGRVVCRWKATDQNIVAQSLRIFYQAIGADGQAGNWIKVPINLSGTPRNGIYADQLAWWPETTERSLNVAVEIKDIAGNPVQLTRQVLVNPSTWRNSQSSTAQVADSRTGFQQTNWGGSNEPQFDQANQQPEHVAENSSSSNNQTAKSHPPNVVCKDGVCRIVKPDPQTPKSHPQRTAQLPDPTVRTVPLNISAQFAGEDVSAPPVPPGFIAGQVTSAPASQHPSSQVWPSEPENWVPKNQTSISTTMQPDSGVAPHPFPNSLPANPVTDVPSNQPTMVHRGNQVIGESSTMGASNQYRGMNSQNGQPIAKSTLLPGIAGVQSNDSNNFDQNQFRQNTVQDQPNPHSQRNFSNAGFSNTRPGSGFENRSGPTDVRPTRDVMPTRASDAPIQIIGSKRFRLNYGIDSIDPSGVARVDLWLTQDDGKTWQAWGSDPDNQSPFPVQVQQEGRYGFRIVVHSRDGLTGQGPSSGDDPDMWILIDTQSPLTRITSVPYGRGQEAGRLVINYAVSDKFLTLRPVALAYSNSPDGPWNAIGQGLRNEGRYLWKPTPDVPDRIFLRIDALDKAGNVGVHVLPQAIDVSGLVPRGTIHGVVPVGARSPGRAQ